MRRRASSRGTGFRLAASGLVLLAVLAGLEGAARLAGPESPIWRAPDNTGVIMTGNPTRLWGMSEGVRQNGETKATISALGLRGTVPTVPRPAGRERILLVGDSSFFGHGVSDADTIGAQLEADLKARGIDVEVVNGAIPGYSTEQTKILLDEVGWATEPTLLLTGNLWSDNNADGFRDVDLLRTSQLYRDNPLAGSAFFKLSAGWIDGMRGGQGGRVITWTKESTWPEAKERRVPVQSYAQNLDFMVRSARERGAGTAFISPANQGLVEGQYKSGAGWDPYFAAQAAVAGYHGCPVASAVEAMQADPAPVGDKFVDLMHPSALGAGDIARKVADVLVAAGWPKNRLLGKAEPFDASGIVDNATVQPGGQSAKYSPQAQLFPDVVDKAGENVPDPDHNEPGQGGPPSDAKWSMDAPTPGQTTQANPAVQGTDGGWDVQGVVSGGVAPIQVSIESPDGRPLGFTRLPMAGAFKVHVRAGTDAVKVIATGSDGKVAAGTGAKGGADVVIAFP